MRPSVARKWAMCKVRVVCEGLRIYVTGARADLRSANGASVAAAKRWALDACDGCTGGASRKRCERGDNEATNLRDCCTGGARMSKRCERGDCEGTNLRDCCLPEGGVTGGRPRAGVHGRSVGRSEFHSGVKVSCERRSQSMTRSVEFLFVVNQWLVNG